MWMAMMVPMMLPSLLPALVRYRRSVRGRKGIDLHGLTALVAAGYFAVWAALGVAAYAAGVGLTAVQGRWEEVTRWLPLAAGALLLLAGAVQFTPWKARQLALCRESAGCAGPLPAGARDAWRHGLELGARCSRSCGNLMLALLAVGMMDLVAMAVVTLVITAERLGPAPLHVARVAGAERRRYLGGDSGCGRA
jgi:predicted metal-binding membrane protein